ncbi:hypothetical protein TWF730_003751 [Orbilia blumenaviensis]|uniref:Clr5 domain-containing protein n=1 Tax=Orbilia blumenaviensis TaxID=1796055 RepID=A0AAV9U394_9PEZI
MALVVSKKRARPCPELDDFKDEIIRRYHLGYSLEKLVSTCNEDFGIQATESQYKGRLYGPWNCRKRIRAYEWVEIDRQMTEREKKETQVVLKGGACISQRALERGRKRNATFTKRLFAAAGVSFNKGENFNIGPRSPQAIEISSPISLNDFTMDVLKRRPKIPFSIIYRLPIMRSQIALNRALQHSSPAPLKPRTAVSLAKYHPSLPLLKVILFRLSNDMFDKDEIYKLLDDVDKLNYRDALKQLLSIKTVSTEAAASNIIYQLYERLDGELATHILETYPKIRYRMYEIAQFILGDLHCDAEFSYGMDSVIYGVQFSNEHYRYEISAEMEERGWEFVSSLQLICADIERFNTRPADVDDARTLFILCKELGHDLRRFSTLWDSESVPALDIEWRWRPGYYCYLPLLTADSCSVVPLVRAGFRSGHALLALKSTIENDYNLFQVSQEVFYPSWEPPNDLGLLRFTVDQAGNFTDRRLREVLRDAVKDLMVMRSCLMGPGGVVRIQEGYPCFPECEQIVETEEHHIRVLLLYIGMMRPELVPSIFDHIQRHNHGRDDYDVILLSLLQHFLVFSKDSPRPLMLEFPTWFLGWPSFHATLNIFEWLLVCGGDDLRALVQKRVWPYIQRGIIAANLSDYIWGKTEEFFEQWPLPELSELLQVCVKHGFDLESPVEDPDLLADTDLYDTRVRNPMEMPEYLYPFSVKIAPQGQQSLLHIIFRQWGIYSGLFNVLLSLGASHQGLQDSFRLDDIAYCGDENDHQSMEWSLNRKFLAAMRNKDYGAISREWKSRIIMHKKVPDQWVALNKAVHGVVALNLNEVAAGPGSAARSAFRTYQRFPGYPGRNIVDHGWDEWPTIEPNCVDFVDQLTERLFSAKLNGTGLDIQAGVKLIKYIMTTPAEQFFNLGTSDTEHLCLETDTDRDGLDIFRSHILEYSIGHLEPRRIGHLEHSRGNLQAIEDLLRDPKCIPVPLQNPKSLVDRVAEHSLNLLKLFTPSWVTIEESYRRGARPLHRAISARQLNTIIYLLSEGADIYARDGSRSGLTAIQQAVHAGQIDTVALFLEVDPNCANHALEAAIERESWRLHIKKYIEDWISKRQEIHGNGNVVNTANISDRVSQALPGLGLSSAVLSEVA